MTSNETQRDADEPRFNSALRTFGRVVAIGVLWYAASVAVITVGAATAAAFAEFADPDNNAPHSITSTFAANFKRCFARATAIWLAELAVIVLAVVDASFYAAQLPRVIVIALALVAVGIARFALHDIACGTSGGVSMLRTFAQDVRRAARTALLRWGALASMVLIDLFLCIFLTSAPFFLFVMPIVPGAAALVRHIIIGRHPVNI